VEIIWNNIVEIISILKCNIFNNFPKVPNIQKFPHEDAFTGEAKRLVFSLK